MRRLRAGDVVLGVAALGLSAIEASLVGDYGPSWPVLLNVLIHLGLSGALVVRRANRRASFVATYVLLAALAAVVWLAPVNLGVSPIIACAPLSLYLVARRDPVGWGVIALLLGIAGAFVSPLRWMPGGSSALWIPLSVFTMVATYLWAAGRRRTELAYEARLAMTREQDARVTEARVAQAQADERSRIARELHDIVAHSLTVVQVQASTGLAVGTPEQMSEALVGVRQASGQALAEIRSMVGALRDQGGATGVSGDIATLPSLVQSARAAGVSLEADLPDAATLNGWQQLWPAQPRLTLVRILQESLTNVIKHGGVRPTARVQLTGNEVSARIDVWNDRAPHGTDPSEPAGFGLVGLRERVLLAGGTLTAGRDADGFRLSAVVPVAPGPDQEQS